MDMTMVARSRRSGVIATAALTLFAGLSLICGGCHAGPTVLGPDQQTIVERQTCEYPPGFVLRPYVVNLSAPTAICFDSNGTLFIAEGGGTYNNWEPHIFGYRPHAPAGQQTFDIYPKDRPFLPFFRNGYQIYGPIGGMVAYNGKLYVTHKDATGNGVVTEFGYDGSHRVVVSDIPARGDYGMGDIAVDDSGRLYFSVGSATNSGVVGPDDWQIGWPRWFADFCDVPYLPLKLTGYRFNSDNPLAGLFGPAQLAVTGPFQAYDTSDRLRIPGAQRNRATSAVYSISPSGGDLKVEAWGVRFARGIACGEFRRVFFTDNGMELRGTRPVENDPDSVLQLVFRGQGGTFYGFPDYTADLNPIGDEQYQPSLLYLRGTGYPEIAALIDEISSHLTTPDPSNMLKGTFPTQSGASKLALVPTSGPASDWFRAYRGGILVALRGDTADFSLGNGGLHLVGHPGYKVVRLDLSTREVSDFVYNTQGGPASSLGLWGQTLERPDDVKFGPDGALYILDYGHMTMKDGKEAVDANTGKIWRLVPESFDVSKN
jgi:glucose/arabinose dehydrogenase